MKEVKITGIILSGGKASRIGKIKGLLRVGNQIIVDNILSKLSPLCEEIILVTDNPSPYQDKEIKIVKDLVLGQGPLRGILTGLKVSKSFYNLVVASDMPFLNPKLLKFLKTKAQEFDVVVPYSRQGLEPLHAIYSKNCISPIEKLTKSCRVISFFNQVKVKYIYESQVRKFDPDFFSFFNVNTLDDLKLAQDIYKEKDGKI